MSAEAATCVSLSKNTLRYDLLYHVHAPCEVDKDAP